MNRKSRSREPGAGSQRAGRRWHYLPHYQLHTSKLGWGRGEKNAATSKATMCPEINQIRKLRCHSKDRTRHSSIKDWRRRRLRDLAGACILSPFSINKMELSLPKIPQRFRAGHQATNKATMCFEINRYVNYGPIPKVGDRTAWKSKRQEARSRKQEARSQQATSTKQVGMVGAVVCRYCAVRRRRGRTHN